MLTLVKVKEEHITNGCRGKPDSCMVTLAVNEVLPKEYHAETSGRYINIYRTDMTYIKTLSLPSEVSVQIGRFDAGEKVEPFEFFLDLSFIVD